MLAIISTSPNLVSHDGASIRARLKNDAPQIANLMVFEAVGSCSTWKQLP
jgi:hypothetical protein